MRKVGVWKVLLLSIVTLGVYWFYWVATRRDEMVGVYRRTIPHWGWVVIPAPLIVVSLFPLVFVGVAASVNTYNFTLWLMAYMAVSLTVAYVISVWWMWKFSVAAEQVTNGRMTKGWAIALYILTGFLVVPFLQYYFNRAKSVKALKSKTTLTPTLKFKVIALTTMAAVTLLIVALSFLDWGVTEPSRADSEVQDLFMKTERLYAEYQGCIDKLSVDFPEYSAETKAAYDNALARCEEIRVEQNKAVDDYNKMTGY